MILKPFQYLYEVGSSLKNKLYDKNYLKQIDIGVPVISVGNLSVGGTGKTPCVQMLVEQILKNSPSKKITIVSRSYKAGLKKPQKVDLNLPNAVEIYGDEPCLLQQMLPSVSVWSGPAKSETARQAVQGEKADVVIVDDGFSHRKLARQFDLVLIDATAPFNYLQPLPSGRLREPMSALNRASAVLITRANLVDAQKIEKLHSMILGAAGHLKNKIFDSQSLTRLPGISSPSELFVFCGLGNPKSFKDSLENLGHKVAVFKSFPDHYSYTVKDLDRLLAEFQAHPGLKLVTTQKDLIKIKRHEILNRIFVAENRIQVLDHREGELLEKINQCI